MGHNRCASKKKFGTLSKKHKRKISETLKETNRRKRNTVFEMKVEHLETSEENIVDPEEFEVEEICGKEIRNGDLYYFIKWKGYSEPWNTWEPVENIYARNKIEEFETKLKQEATTIIKLEEEPDFKVELIEEPEAPNPIRYNDETREIVHPCYIYKI